MRNWKVRLLHRRCTDFKIFKAVSDINWDFYLDGLFGAEILIEIPRIPIPWTCKRRDEVPDEELEKHFKGVEAHWEEQRKLFPKKGDLVEFFYYGRKVRAVITWWIGFVIDHEWLPYNLHRPIHTGVDIEFSEFTKKAIINANYRNGEHLPVRWHNDKKVKQ